MSWYYEWANLPHPPVHYTEAVKSPAPHTGEKVYIQTSSSAGRCWATVIDHDPVTDIADLLVHTANAHDEAMFAPADGWGDVVQFGARWGFGENQWHTEDEDHRSSAWRAKLRDYSRAVEYVGVDTDEESEVA